MLPDAETAISIARRLFDANYLAQREFPVVGSAEHPTPWDTRHQELNDLLDQLHLIKGWVLHELG